MGRLPFPSRIAHSHTKFPTHGATMPSIDRTRKVEIATASVRKFVQGGALARAANLLTKFRSADIVEILDGLGGRERLLVWKALRAADARLAGDALAEMPERVAAAILTELGPS